MKRQVLLFLLLSIFISTHAQSPKWLKKARGAQVSVFAYDNQGQLHQAEGTIVNPNGIVITEFDALKYANKIIVTDQQGTEYPVIEIMGANAMYNVAKLLIQPGKKKLVALESVTRNLNVDEQVFVMPNCKSEKSTNCKADKITKVENFKTEYCYYSLSETATDRNANCAVMTTDGQLIGLYQLPVKEGSNGFIIDQKYIQQLKVNSLDANNNDLNAIFIPKTLPDSEEDASTYLFLSSSKDTTLYNYYIEQFIQKFPKSTNGYIMKAEKLISQQNYIQAEEVYNHALELEEIKRDEIYYSMSNQIYALNLNPTYKLYSDWNLEKAFTLATEAYKSNPLPVYTLLQANILYALKKYSEAREKYLATTQTNLRSPEIFLYAAQCLKDEGKDINEIISLMDSAICCYPTPLPAAAAGAVLMRGNALSQAEKYREAIKDYNEYEHLSGGKVTAKFYYEREQLEIKCRMYGPALNDIEKSVKMMPNDPVLNAEAAAVNYRVNQLDEAIQFANIAIQLDETFADAYRILGVCYNQKGNKAEAKKQLQKAIELGDQMSQSILDKIQ